MPSLSFTAILKRCLQPMYRSVVCTETCPRRNWICSSSPPESWQSRGHSGTFTSFPEHLDFDPRRCRWLLQASDGIRARWPGNVVNVPGFPPTSPGFPRVSRFRLTTRFDGQIGSRIGIGVSKGGVHRSEFLQRSAHTSIIAANIWTDSEYGENR